jgi:hypothetical protein
MRGQMCIALALGVWLVGTGGGQADEQADALKIVDAAIGAAGGAAKLDKLKIMSLKGKGIVHEGAKEAAIMMEATVQGLDRFRVDLDVNANDEAVKLLVVFNSGKGWVKFNERLQDAPANAIPLMQAELHAVRMAQMLTPLKDKDVKLSPLGEIKIDRRAAEGIKVVKKDCPDLDLYFDKQTHLPIKCELRVKEPDDQEMTHEWVFSGVKETDGIKHFQKAVLNRDGKKMIEMEISDVKPEEKVDEGTFAKP